MAAGPATQDGGLEWPRLAADKNIALPIAAKLWAQAKAGASDPHARSELFHRLLEEAAKETNVAPEPGKQTLVDAPPTDPAAAAAAGPGKTTQVLLDKDQKPGAATPTDAAADAPAAAPAGANAAAAKDAAGAAPGADANKKDEEPTAKPTVDKLHQAIVAAASAGQQALAELATAHPATIMEVLSQVRAGETTLLQKVINTLGAAIERRLGDVLPDPEKKADGPPGIKVPVVAGDGEVQVHFISDAGVPMLGAMPVAQKVAQWRADIQKLDAATQDALSPTVGRITGLNTTATDQAKTAKLGDEPSKTALEATQKQLGPELGNVSRRVQEAAKPDAATKPDAAKADAPAASAAPASAPTAPAPSAPAAAADTSNVATPAAAPTAPAPTPAAPTAAPAEAASAAPSTAAAPTVAAPTVAAPTAAAPAAAAPDAAGLEGKVAASKDPAAPTPNGPDAAKDATGAKPPLDQASYNAHIRQRFSEEIAELDTLSADFKKADKDGAREHQTLKLSLEEVELLVQQLNAMKKRLAAKKAELAPKELAKEEKKIQGMEKGIEAQHAVLDQKLDGKTMPELRVEAEKLRADVLSKGEKAKSAKDRLESIMNASILLGSQIDKTSAEKGRELYDIKIDKGENPALLAKARTAGIDEGTVAELAVHYRNWGKEWLRREIMRDDNHREILFLRDTGVYGSPNGLTVKQVMDKEIKKLPLSKEVMAAALGTADLKEVADVLSKEELSALHAAMIGSAATANAGVTANSGVKQDAAASPPPAGSESAAAVAPVTTPAPTTIEPAATTAPATAGPTMAGPTTAAPTTAAPATPAAAPSPAAATNGPTAAAQTATPTEQTAPAATPAPTPTTPAPATKKSKHGGAPPAQDWRKKVAATIPSEKVVTDDPGHTYHVLKNGEAVATSEESKLNKETTDLAVERTGVKPEMDVNQQPTADATPPPLDAKQSAPDGKQAADGTQAAPDGKQAAPVQSLDQAQQPAKEKEEEKKAVDWTVKRADLKIEVRPPKKDDPYRWQVSFLAIGPTGNELLVGNAGVLMDDNGRPVGPTFVLDNRFKHNGVDHKVRIVDDGGKGVSLTALALDEGMKAFKEAFGYEVENLGGSLADDNKLNFQRAFYEAEQKGLPSAEAKLSSIRKISYGKHRAARGFDDFQVKISDERVEVDIGDPYGKQMVPKTIHVDARKF